MRAALGHEAAVEYPGYISIVPDNPDLPQWALGRASGPWGGDLSHGESGQPVAAFELPGTEGWTDARDIAVALHAAMLVAEGK